MCIAGYSITFSFKCVHETTSCDTAFFVADTPGPVILGLPACRKLKLVSHIELCSERSSDGDEYAELATITRSNPQKTALALRSTPIHLLSTAEMLNARKYKSNPPPPAIMRNEH